MQAAPPRSIRPYSVFCEGTCLGGSRECVSFCFFFEFFSSVFQVISPFHVPVPGIRSVKTLVREPVERSMVAHVPVEYDCAHKTCPAQSKESCCELNAVLVPPPRMTTAGAVAGPELAGRADIGKR